MRSYWGWGEGILYVYLVFSDFLHHCILHGAGGIDGPLEALLHSSPSAEEEEQDGLKLHTAVGCLIQLHRGGEQHCALGVRKKGEM